MSGSSGRKRPRRTPASDRSAVIRELLGRGQPVSLGELAGRFRVSEMTVRRDFDKLVRLGVARRVHGGAVATDRLACDFNLEERYVMNREAKAAIAREAARLIRTGMRIIIGSGTTTLELARQLKEMPDLTVITPSLAVAAALQYAVGVQTVLLGGIITAGSQDLTGVVTESTLDLFVADLAFLGADAVAPNGGVSSGDDRVAMVERKIRKRAGRTYLLADGSKIGRSAANAPAHISEFTGLITDQSANAASARLLQGMAVEVIVAAEG